MFRKENLAQFLRFCTVGLVNTAVDFSVFFLLLAAGTAHIPAQVLSYSAGLANSFIFNRRWTFRSDGRLLFAQIGRFLTVNLLSLLASTILLDVFYDSLRWQMWICKVTASSASVMINYQGSRLWVFYGQTISESKNIMQEMPEATGKR